ncbi:DMT family transporter [Brevibacillus ginsengisoli]|uniref:DMT family transporter n=1 Tax=Brevibacillus ginsengisoli TaxID=363854 RepID=UPI003CF1CA5B
MKWIFPLLALVGGVAISTQASINGGLGRKIGAIEASLVSFAIGTLALLFITIFLGKGNLSSIGSIPKWQLTGGILGAFYVVVMVLAVPQVGVTTTVASVIAGQIIMSAIVDHYGLFGAKQIPFDLRRLAALILMFGSLYLFFKKD